MKKERKEYEQKYLSRYKQPKIKKNVSSDLYKPEIPKPKRQGKNARNTSRNIFHVTNNQRQRKMLVLIYTNRKYQNQNET